MTAGRRRRARRCRARGPASPSRWMRRDVNVYYGEKQALKDIDLDDPRASGDGADRPVRLRQVDVPALPQPHERHDRHRRGRRADHARRPGHLRPEASTSVQLRARVGMVFQKPNPFPKSIYENVAYGPRIHGLASRAGGDGRDRDEEPAARRPVERGQGPPEGAGHRPVRRPAAAPVHRPRHRGQPRSDPDGRALLGARPDRHRAYRGADRRAARRTTRSSSSPIPCSRRRACPSAPPSSISGELVEVGDTDEIFTTPRDKRTQDYITGRFG